MWSQKSDEKDTETLLKETLLRQLSHAVKEVQLYYSQTNETCTTQEGTSSLILVLEAIFLHAIKRSLLDSARRSMAVADDHRPSPVFYSAVRSVTHKNTEAQIAALPQVTTAVGRSRAWIRLALNDAAVPSYMAAIAVDKRVPRYYRPGAFLRDREALDTAAHLMEGLIQVPFDIPLNSSLLNVWSAEPLHMSGVWCPATRETVYLAVDVAGGIEDDETCSLITASSSMHSLMMMDEMQAIQMILASTATVEETESPEEEEGGREEEKDEEAGRNLPIMGRSFSCLVDSVSPRDHDDYIAQPPQSAGNPFDDGGIDEIQKETQPETEPEEIAKPCQKYRRKSEPDDFNKLLLLNVNNVEPEQIIPDNANTKPQKRQEDIKRNMEDIIFYIQQELGLRLQKFECADCRLSIGLNFGAALLCHVTGEYLCESCHFGDTSVVPARIIYNWDFTKYPVGKRALEYLSSRDKEPDFDLQKLNPLLSNAVPELKEISQLRRQLNYLHHYLTVCKESVEINAREYLYLATEKYSLADLLLIPGGYLKSEISKIVEQARSHVIGCWICKQKGFICELCQDPQVIYPFDAGSVYRCSKCNAVYHGGCLNKGRKCPKCQRKKQRESEDKKVELEN